MVSPWQRCTVRPAAHAVRRSFPPPETASRKPAPRRRPCGAFMVPPRRCRPSSRPPSCAAARLETSGLLERWTSRIAGSFAQWLQVASAKGSLALEFGSSEAAPKDSADRRGREAPAASGTARLQPIRAIRVIGFKPRGKRVPEPRRPGLEVKQGAGHSSWDSGVSCRLAISRGDQRMTGTACMPSGKSASKRPGCPWNPRAARVPPLHLGPVGPVPLPVARVPIPGGWRQARFNGCGYAE